MIFYNANIRKLHSGKHTTISENVLPLFRDIKLYNSPKSTHHLTSLLSYYNSQIKLFSSEHMSKTKV